MAIHHLAKAGLLVGVGTGLELAETAINKHRLKTHHSIGASPNTEAAMDYFGSPFADSGTWPATHRIHHRIPDANLVSFIELADFADWREGQSSAKERELEMPDKVVGYDPAAKEINTKDAIAIGRSARTLVEGLYTPPEDYPIIKTYNILNETKPRYFYEDRKVMKEATRKPVNSDDENLSAHDLRFLLRDPHAPALHRGGVPGVLRDNVPLYGYVEQSMRDPRFRDPDLAPSEREEWLRDHRTAIRLGYVGAMVLANIGLRKPNSGKELVGSAVLGAAASGLSVVGLITGGNVTNSFGHAGDLKKNNFRDMMHGKVIPKMDGTYTSNDKALSPITLDEVGGQEDHHNRPDDIAYTTERGIKRFATAPFGTSLEFMVRHGIIFKEGDDFPEGAPRPDVPHESVVALQGIRRAYLRREEALAA